MKCINQECRKKPTDGVFVGVDGDMVCNEKCKVMYEKQKAKFFNETIHDDRKFTDWMFGNQKG